MRDGCPVMGFGHLLGKKWTIPIIQELLAMEGAGFNEIYKAASYIQPKILSQRLKEMEKAGLIEKAASSHTQKYTLTEKGRDFQRVVEVLKDFSIRWEEGDLSFCKKMKCTECF